MKVETLDLGFQGTSETIAAYLLKGPEGPVLVETGPASTLGRLLEELKARDVEPDAVEHVFVTHVHLDHAGAAGWWAQRGVRVYVHPTGAPHLVDPTRLLRSVKRVFGDQSDVLWGRTVPAPPTRVVTVADGETIRAGGMELRAIDTPGHASHHYCFRVEDLVFTGDATGVRLAGSQLLELPAPPPEFDPELWKLTIARLRQERATKIYPTHFGPVENVPQHLEEFERVLDETTALVKPWCEGASGTDEITEVLGRERRKRAEALGVPAPATGAYEVANPLVVSALGLSRYWAKQRGRK